MCKLFQIAFAVVGLSALSQCHAVFLRHRPKQLDPTQLQAAQVPVTDAAASDSVAKVPPRASAGLEAVMVELAEKGDADGLNAIFKAVDESLIPLLRKDVADMQKQLDDAYDMVTGCQTKANTCNDELDALHMGMTSAKNDYDTAVKASETASGFSVCETVSFTGMDGLAAGTAGFEAFKENMELKGAEYVRAKTNVVEKETARDDAITKYYAKRGECFGTCNACFDAENAAYAALVTAARGRLVGQQEDLRTYELIKCVATESAGGNSAEVLGSCRTATVDVSSINYTFKDYPVIGSCGDEIACSAYHLPYGVDGDFSGSEGACTNGIVLAALKDNKCHVKCKAGFHGEPASATVECLHRAAVGDAPVQEPLTCTENRCTCPSNGWGTTNTACATHNTEKCGGCYGHYHIEGTRCVENVCTCGSGAGGSAGRGSAGTCASHNSEYCTSCHGQYHLEGGRCVENVCSCTGGSGGRGSAGTCSSHNSEYCTGCSGEYRMYSDGKCVIYRCHTERQWHYNSPCTIHPLEWYQPTSHSGWTADGWTESGCPLAQGRFKFYRDSEHCNWIF